MRTLIIATLIVACNTTDTTETETTAETEQTETSGTSIETPVDVVDEEAKRLKREAAEFNAEGETLTTEDNSVDGFEENSE